MFKNLRGMIMDFSSLRHTPKLSLVIAGGRDDIGPARAVEKMLPKWNPTCEFKAIEGADHFYSGKSRELEAVIAAFFDS